MNTRLEVEAGPPCINKVLLTKINFYLQLIIIQVSTSGIQRQDVIQFHTLLLFLVRVCNINVPGHDSMLILCIRQYIPQK